MGRTKGQRVYTIQVEDEEQEAAVAARPAAQHRCLRCSVLVEEKGYWLCRRHRNIATRYYLPQFEGT